METWAIIIIVLFISVALILFIYMGINEKDKKNLIKYKSNVPLDLSNVEEISDEQKIQNNMKLLDSLKNNSSEYHNFVLANLDNTLVRTAIGRNANIKYNNKRLTH